MHKLILTDCDGVLLNWEWMFQEWMKNRGYTLVQEYRHLYGMHDRFNITKEEKQELVRVFNDSAAIAYVPPLRDAVRYVTKLHEEGYRFHVITSLSTDPFAFKARRDNLHRFFGDIFEEIVCLDCGADKDEALAKYEGSNLMWVEDKVANAEVGKELGLESVLIAHEFNNNEQGLEFQRYQTWQDLYYDIQDHYDQDD